MKNMLNHNINFIKVDAPPKRHHKALFDDNLPFKQRVERSKKSEYNRKQKHREFFA